MITFFDTETTGLPDFNKRASDPSQPHIVQFAAITVDHNGKELVSHNLIVRPDGWGIPVEATRVHGITNEFARENGVPEEDVAKIILSLFTGADRVVAHNVTFDKFIARIALRRFGLLTDAMALWWSGLPTVCTMRATTNICRIPSPRFEGEYKWPKLSEAYEFAFGEKLEGAHDALVDVRACRRIYDWLQGEAVS